MSGISVPAVSVHQGHDQNSVAILPSTVIVWVIVIKDLQCTTQRFRGAPGQSKCCH